MSDVFTATQLPGNFVLGNWRKTLLVISVGAVLSGVGCTQSGASIAEKNSDSHQASTDVGSDASLMSDTLIAENASSEAESSETMAPDADDIMFETPDWTEDSHSNDVDPDFAEVFDDTQVKRLDFVIKPERWQAMLDDMTETYGEFGSRASPDTSLAFPPDTGGIRPGGAANLLADPNTALGGYTGRDPMTLANFDPTRPDPSINMAEGAERPQSDEQESQLESDSDPIFVPADVYYNGQQWYSVGIRFKGNSTLQGSWSSGIEKLSFKMDFDEFEDDYPQIDNQRFFGFKKFSLKNNYLDPSQLREKVAADIFRDAGLAASHTGFYTLYVDHGNGPEYFGLYTLVEEVDGSLIDTQFANDDGNLYKPEEGSANFVDGSFSEEDFVKKTNEDDEDWSDIIALFQALHADSASDASETWRKELETLFDVDAFLKYLAVNGIIQNWDTYGRMPHNYFLYNNPDTQKLTWIPWDNNEAFQDGKQGGALALDFSNLDAAAWPLIANIYADAVYKARYDNYLFEVISDAFETSSIQATYDNYKELIAPYATTERAGYSFVNSPDDFYDAVDALIMHASDRADAVNAYLDSQ